MVDDPNQFDAAFRAAHAPPPDSRREMQTMELAAYCGRHPHRQMTADSSAAMTAQLQSGEIRLLVKCPEDACDQAAVLVLREPVSPGGPLPDPLRVLGLLYEAAREAARVSGLPLPVREEAAARMRTAMELAEQSLGGEATR